MTTETHGWRRFAPAVGVALVGLVVGLALFLAGGGRHAALKGVGVVMIVAGLFLLTLPDRYLYIRVAGLQPAAQVFAERRLRLQTRIASATGILSGVALWLDDPPLRMAVLLCAAVVSVVGAIRFWRDGRR